MSVTGCPVTPARRYEDAGLGVGLLTGVGPPEPLPEMLPLDVVSDGVAEALALSEGEPVPDGPSDGDPVDVGLLDTGVGDPVVVTGVAVGDPVKLGVAVADGLPLVVGLGAPVGVAAGQFGDDVAE